MIRFNRDLKVNYAVVKKGHSHFTQGYMNTKMKEFKQGKLVFFNLSVVLFVLELREIDFDKKAINIEIERQVEQSIAQIKKQQKDFQHLRGIIPKQEVMQE